MMNGNLFSHFIDHFLLSTYWIMKLDKLKLKATQEVRLVVVLLYIVGLDRDWSR